MRTQSGKIEVDEDKNDGHLPEVQKHAPIDACLFVLGIEEQTHYKRRRPGHVENINVPKTLGWQVQIASVVGSKGLTDTPKQNSGGSELPKKAAENQRTPHGLQTRDENEDADEKLYDIGENRAGPRVTAPLQNRCMGGKKREGKVKKIAARCHGIPERDDASILWQETRGKDYSRGLSFKQLRRLHKSIYRAR